MSFANYGIKIAGQKSGLGGDKESGLACGHDCMAPQNSCKRCRAPAVGVGDGFGAALGMDLGAWDPPAAHLCAGYADALLSGEIGPGTKRNLF